MPEPAERLVIVLTTVSQPADAERLARALVDERLAACVNVLPPMQSIYRWNGEVSRETEQQLVIKTAPARLEALEGRLRALHPYELPECVVLRGSASAAYAAWVDESTR